MKNVIDVQKDRGEIYINLYKQWGEEFVELSLGWWKWDTRMKTFPTEVDMI